MKWNVEQHSYTSILDICRVKAHEVPARLFAGGIDAQTAGLALRRPRRSFRVILMDGVKNKIPSRQ
jgi:hypothetical protein